MQLDKEEYNKIQATALSIEGRILEFLDTPLTEEEIMEAKLRKVERNLMGWIMSGSYGDANSDSAFKKHEVLGGIDFFGVRDQVLNELEKEKSKRLKEQNLDCRLLSIGALLGECVKHLKTQTLSEEVALEILDYSDQLYTPERIIITIWVTRACPAIKDKIEQEV